jgi:ABC-type glycerol-3-phosphate transport system substrate-binding protein
MSAVKRGAAAVLACALLASCGGTAPVVAVPTATASVAPTTAATPTPAATAAPTLAPTSKPSPMVSAKGNITVTSPLRGDQITPPLTIAGQASVFEATVAWRIVTASGTVLAQGNTLASAGAPQKGTFETKVSFAMPYYGEAGFVEVYEVSPKDGSISDIVRVPVGIAGSY